MSQSARVRAKKKGRPPAWETTLVCWDDCVDPRDPVVSVALQLRDERRETPGVRKTQLAQGQLTGKRTGELL